MAGKYPSSDDGTDSQEDELQRGRLMKHHEPVQRTRRASAARVSDPHSMKTEHSRSHRRTQSHQATHEHETINTQKRNGKTESTEPKSSEADFYGPSSNPPGRRQQEAEFSQKPKSAQITQQHREGMSDDIAISTSTAKSKSTELSPMQFWTDKREEERHTAVVPSYAPPNPTHQKQSAGVSFINNALSALGVVSTATTKNSRERMSGIPSSNTSMHEEAIMLRQKVLHREEQLQSAVKHISGMKNKHKAHVGRVEEELQLERQRNKALSRELHNTEMALEKEKKQALSGKATIRTLQEAHLQSVESTRFVPIATSDIQQSLSNLQTRVRQWAKKWFELPFDQFIQSTAFAQLSRGLVKRGCLVDDEKIYHVLLSKDAVQKPGRASVLLLGAAVFTDILANVVGDPYFGFVGGDHLSSPVGAALRDLVGFVGQGDEAGAEALRCQSLRLLDPPQDDKDAGIVAIRNTAEHSRACASQRLAQSILAEFSDAFSIENLPRAGLELEELIAEASALSHRLWTRKARVVMWRPEKQWYSSQSEDVAAHPLHMGELDDDPNALEASEIVLVCSPAVWVHGTTEGKDFQAKRMIKKAVVWMG